MRSGHNRGRSAKSKRWALALVLLLVTLVASALAVPRLWVRSSKKAPQHLDLLYTALNEFNATNFDQASAILDRRAAEVAPTSLDWMLRARIAEAQSRPEQALDYLKHIPDSDSISASVAQGGSNRVGEGACAGSRGGVSPCARDRPRPDPIASRAGLPLRSEASEAGM